MQPLSTLEIWLNFIKELIWPLTLLIIVISFRKRISELIERLTNLKMSGAEMAFQAPSPESHTFNKKTNEEVSALIYGGFFTIEGIKNIVRSSEHYTENENILDAILIFSTLKQRTWIVITNHQVYCLLDDENTRSYGKVVQWVLEKDQTSPIKAHQYKKSIGLLDIGVHRNWLYSTNLFPQPKLLEEKLNLHIS